MAWQLVYTSAPELLEAGRSGFGTVAKHEAIRSLLQTELERISQFNREQGLSKERIVFAHRVFDLRGERFHVLSRISDAGADYTGRTNHIAHHIILSASEAAQASARRCTPADMILWATSSGLWRERWNEHSRLLLSEEEIGTDSVPARMGLPAVTWRMVTGSAANAAILAPGGTATDGCWLLFREDQAAQLLPLIRESLCLHPNPWNISFSTDTQHTDRIEEIQWRGVAAGSPLEGTARQSVRPVLDLGNQEELRKCDRPESAVHLAETGLMKAPPPIVSSSGATVTSRDRGISEGSLSRVPSGAFRTGNRSVSQPGNISLKDRMKGSGVVKGDNSKRIPLSWFVMGALAILLMLGAFVWNACIFDQGEFVSIRNSTNLIIYGLTGDKGEKPGDDWWNQLASKQGITLWGSLKIVPMGYKQDIRTVKEQLKGLANSYGTPALEKDFNDASRANYSGLLGEIINKIVRQKKDKDSAEEKAKGSSEAEDKKREEATAKAASALQQKTNQTITLKIGGGLVTNGQSIMGTIGQKLVLDASSSSASSVSISKSSGPGDLMGNTLKFNEVGLITLHLSATGNEKINPADMDIQINIVPPEARITAVKFTRGNTYAEVFKTDPLKGWSFFESDEYANNLQNLSSILKTSQWKTNVPLYHLDFDERSKKTGHCFFRKDEANQEVSLTISVDPIGPIANALGYQPILIEQSGETYKSKLDPKIAPSIELLKLNNSIDYEVNNVRGQSLEEIDKKITSKILEYTTLVQVAQQAYEKDQKARQQATNSQAFLKPESILQKYPDFDNAGAKLSEGLTFKKNLDEKVEGLPPEFQRYSAWLKGNNQTLSRKSYREYLSKLFAKIKDSKKSVTCPMGNYFSSDDKIKDDFKSLGNANTENGRLKLGWNQPSSSTDDKKFMDNLQAYFNESNTSLISQIFDPPKPTPMPRNFEQDLGDAKKALEVYRSKFERDAKTSVKILDSNNQQVLIFKQ